MKIEPFGVEIWMNEWETRCELNLAETCVDSISLQKLLELCGEQSDHLNSLLPLTLSYGPIEGSLALRQAIASYYAKQSADNVIVTHGTIGANMLVHRALVESSDQVVCIAPTYQQHYSIPESIGAQIKMLWFREEDAWLPDLGALRSLCSEQTKLIALTNPNNPTGSLIEQQMLEEIVDIARSCDAWLLCDEVYRGIDQQGSGITTSIADLYERGISTASVSKAFSLAGLRLGWVVAPEQVCEAVMIQRDYDTISVGRIDDALATLALENRDAILARSREITRANLQILARWIESQPLMSWVQPKAGTTALVKYDLPLSSREFCEYLLEQTGVMFTPGSALGMEGYVRIGFANDTQALVEGLEKVSEYLVGLNAGG